MIKFSGIGHKSENLSKLAKELDAISAISEDFKLAIWTYATNAFMDGIDTGKELAIEKENES